jgi:hypothetical protein
MPARLQTDLQHCLAGAGAHTHPRENDTDSYRYHTRLVELDVYTPSTVRFRREA